MENAFNNSDLKRMMKLVKNEIRNRRCHISLEGLFDLEQKIRWVSNKYKNNTIS